MKRFILPLQFAAALGIALVCYLTSMWVGGVQDEERLFTRLAVEIVQDVRTDGAPVRRPHGWIKRVAAARPGQVERLIAFAQEQVKVIQGLGAIDDGIAGDNRITVAEALPLQSAPPDFCTGRRVDGQGLNGLVSQEDDVAVGAERGGGENRRAGVEGPLLHTIGQTHSAQVAVG